MVLARRRQGKWGIAQWLGSERAGNAAGATLGRTAILARMQHLGILAVCALLVAGCQSTRSWQQGCPGIYSGVRYYADIRKDIPWDGRVYFTIDLIPTSIIDTLALPVTAFLTPKPPVGRFPVGCRWARPSALDRRSQHPDPARTKS